MKNKITVIIYIKWNGGGIGHRMRSEEFRFWHSKRKVSQKILWDLVNEIDTSKSAITNIQIF